MLWCSFYGRVCWGAHVIATQHLVGNGCCIVAYLTVVAEQRVHMPRYVIYDIHGRFSRKTTYYYYYHHHYNHVEQSGLYATL
jgi:hypothetical protein